jgi:hypothetical protein
MRQPPSQGAVGRRLHRQPMTAAFVEERRSPPALSLLARCERLGLDRSLAKANALGEVPLDGPLLWADPAQYDRRSSGRSPRGRSGAEGSELPSSL